MSRSSSYKLECSILRSIAAWVREKLKLILITVTYFTSMRVIFYTEIAIIMLCFMDLTFNITTLIIVICIRSNYAYTHSALAIGRSPHLNPFYWNKAVIVLLATYLIESLIRIYYCLKLAYQHHLKVREGDLCCMKCHKPLVSAAMSTLYIMPHFVSALCLVVYFIHARVWTAYESVDFHTKYFANNPFVKKSIGHGVTDTMYYKMGTRVLGTLRNCLNSSLSIEDASILLLQTGDLMSLVGYKCAVNGMHCTYGRYLLQLSVESVQSLLNYTVIRALLNHVINMQQFEVHNLQTRLHSKDGSRIIRVYKVQPRRALRASRFTSGVIHLPRQALMSLMHLGSQVASRLRTSERTKSDGSSAGSDESLLQIKDLLPDNSNPLKVVPITMPNDLAEEQPLESVETDSDEVSWPEDDTFRTGSIQHQPVEVISGKPDSEAPSGSYAIARGDLGSRLVDFPMGTSSQQRLYNRKDAASLSHKKVNFEHVRVDDLHPHDDDPSQQPAEEGVLSMLPKSQLNSAQEQTPGLASKPAASKPTTANLSDATVTTLTASASSPADVTVSRSTLRSRRSSKRCGNESRGKRVNDSIFTDETFYSL